MEKIDVEKMKNGYDLVIITTDEGTFEISFQNNLDLYWYYHGNPFKENNKKFLITKENSYLYDSLNDLFEAIEENKPYLNYPGDLEHKDRKVEYYTPEDIGLLRNNTIIWHSDDDVYDESSVLRIKKMDELFIVEFTKSNNKMFETFSIRFRNSGSRYDPYNISFMNMYRKLYNYDYQISIEDYLYQEHKKKKL